MNFRLLAVTVLTFAIATSVAHATVNNFTWTGGAATGTTAWSSTSNWTSSPTASQAPSASVGTLAFPSLGACDSSTNTCYTSNNDVSGISASDITIDDGVPYQITGDSISLGSGGLQATLNGADVCCDSPPTIGNSIALTAGQNWSVDGGTGGFGQLAVNGDVTGSGSTLGVALPNQGVLALTGHDEVGNVTVTSSTQDGLLAIGFPGQDGELNSTDGNSVGVTNVTLFANGAIGALTASGSNVQVGQQDHPGTLAVSGNASLDSTSTLHLNISQAGTTAGTDYSQLSAAGNIDITGAGLNLSGTPDNVNCPTLTVDDVYTLVQASGTRTGTFASIPDGTTVPVQCSEYGFNGTDPTVRINYTSTAVTATVVSSGSGGGMTPTSTALSISNSTPQTGDQVTYTATVAPGGASAFDPTGVVDFFDNGNPIANCAGQPLSLGSPFTATCVTSYDSAGSHIISASYEGDANFTGSSSDPQTVTVSAPASPPPPPPAPPPSSTPPPSGGTVSQLPALGTLFAAPIQFSPKLDTVIGTVSITQAGSTLVGELIFNGTLAAKVTIIGKTTKKGLAKGMFNFKVQIAKKYAKALKKKKSLKVTLKTIVTPPGGKAVVKTKKIVMKRGTPRNGCAAAVAHAAC